jgi:hypothetical protein
MIPSIPAPPPTVGNNGNVEIETAFDPIAATESAIKFLTEQLPDCKTENTPAFFLVSTCQFGFPELKGKQGLNEELRIKLLKILKKCQDKTPEAAILFAELVDGFINCQPTQQATIDRVYGKLNRVSFASDLGLAFDDLKQDVLDETIKSFYPKCETASDNTPWDQFPHIKMGYLVALGGHLGFSDKTMLQIAKNDKFHRKHTDIEKENPGKFIKIFNEKLFSARVHFLMNMAKELNRDEDKIAAQDSLYSDWVKTSTEKFTNCFYDEDSIVHKWFNPPTKKQEEATTFYFSPYDVLRMLKEIGDKDKTGKMVKIDPSFEKELLVSLDKAISIRNDLKSLYEKLESQPTNKPIKWKIKDNQKSCLAKDEWLQNISLTIKTEEEKIKTTEEKIETKKRIVITLQNTEGFNSFGKKGQWFSLMLPEGSFRVNTKDGEPTGKQLDELKILIDHFNKL